MPATSFDPSSLLKGLFTKLLPQMYPIGYSQSRRTKTPVMFAEMPEKENATFSDIPFKYITVNSRLRGDTSPETSAIIRHEDIHGELRRLGVPITPFGEKMRPAIEEELRSRDYPEYKMKQDYFLNPTGHDATIDEGLAYAMTDKAAIKNMPEEARQRFIKDSLDKLRSQGKDTKILESLATR